MSAINKKILFLLLVILPFVSLKASEKTPIVETIAIQSNVDDAWETIIDFANYHQWNQWVVKIKGEAFEGSQVKAYSKSGNALDLKITKMSAPYEICWVDVTWFTYFGMGGWRCRKIEENPNGSGILFTNHFEYTGVFAKLLRFYTYDFLVEGMKLENKNLKEYLEK